MSRAGRPPVPPLWAARALLERQVTDVGMSEMFLDREKTIVKMIPLTWQRHCPMCGVWLEKRQPTDPWVCRCGWRG